MGVKVLVIGGGGREHALAWKLSQSPKVSQIFVAPGNAGTATIAKNVDIGFTDVAGLLKFAQDNSVDLTLIGQEAASDAGVVDAFQTAGLAIFGPTIQATKIESSKAYSKDLMGARNIPTAEYQNFTDPEEASKYAKTRSFPLVIKASGLAEGKGVVIAENEEEALQAITDMMINKTFKEAGNTIVIEDFLAGQEVSTHALSDGSTAVLFPSSQDHKQVNDGDEGPNTGGMGVFAPVPWVTKQHLDFALNSVVQPALDGLKADNAPFTGCLYPGLMIDGEKVKVLEFNARFGDPEAETYMRLLDGDLYEILMSCVQGNLDSSAVKWLDKTVISVAVASGGYPGGYQKGLPITGIEEAEKLDDIVVFQAGTATKDGQLVTNGGRVLYVTAVGDSIDSARAKAYKAIKLIHFDDMHFRTDIGLRQPGAEK